MIWCLRLLFLTVLASMLAVTSWASLHQSLGDFMKSTVAGDPWFLATLADAYWGFLTFYVWVAYKERSWIARVLWLIAILLGGNIAMSIYCLIQLFRVDSDAKLEDVLLRSRPA
jgi:hypothetical protein